MSKVVYEADIAQSASDAARSSNADCAMNEVCRKWMSHVAYRRVILHMDTLLCIWTSRATHQRVMPHK